ncbi:MAG: fimbria/pilus periplasmic chaperone [Pseudomonadota bacterium]|nr:fimbria/pilus periplasmic chaperone [Pseudomonadota bacterium]
MTPFRSALLLHTGAPIATLTPSARTFIAWLLLAAMILPMLPAHADLMINPTRIVFDKNKRSAQIDLINDGATSATYRLALVNRRMTDAGEFNAIETAGPGDAFADAMLVYSPRQITLAPGAQQLVRIALRKPEELAPGEYRSHLFFEKVAETTAAQNIENLGRAPAGEVGVSITALLGVSIPLIVRHGDTAAQVSIDHLALEPAGAGQAPLLSLQLNRSGNRSVFGDLTASFKPQGGAEQVIGKAGGLAVYTPNALRRAKLNLQLPAGMVLAHGTLSVTYQERPEDGGRLMAAGSIDMP